LLFSVSLLKIPDCAILTGCMTKLAKGGLYFYD
jgi:hypothetical protein